MVRRHGDWMCSLDERILEYLDGVGWSEPRLMAKHGGADATPERVQERCRVLARVEYVVPTRDDKRPENARLWELGYWGNQYLNGEVDADLRRPLPAPRPPEAVRPGWYAGFG